MSKEAAQPPANPNLHFSTGEFTLPNGDTYVGDYCAHVYGLIWREGYGTYYTQDGHTYEGYWKDDKLIENTPIKIKYLTGEEYHGITVKDKYVGEGTYILKDKMAITCQFFDNRPTGSIYMIDIHGHVWQGEAGESNAILYPENNFYYALTDTLGIGKLKKKYRNVPTEEVGNEEEEEEEDEMTDEDWRQIIFAKGTKTEPDTEFGASKWCRKFLRFEAMKNKVNLKRKNLQKLTKEEEKWFKKYELFKKNLKMKQTERNMKKNEPSVTDISLLKTYCSEEYRKSCPPLKILYPKSTQESIDEEEEEEELLKYKDCLCI